MKPWLKELLIALAGGAACVCLIMLLGMTAGATAGHGLNGGTFVSALLLLPGMLLVTVFGSLLGDHEVLLGTLLFLGNAWAYAVPVWLWRHLRARRMNPRAAE